MDLLPLPLGVPHPVRQFFTIYYFVSSFHFLCYTLQRAEHQITCGTQQVQLEVVGKL